MGPFGQKQYPLSPTQNDRAAGVLYGVGCGDALGAPYEFHPARIYGEEVGMVGGGSFGWEPGEWTDDTSMAIAIAEISAQNIDLRDEDALDLITARFVEWSQETKDIGIQTSAVLSAVRAHPNAMHASREAINVFHQTGSTGNGSLMRTAPIALAYLHDEDARHEAAYAVSGLTHGDEEAGEACALWCDAIAYAVLHGTFDGLHLAVENLTAPRRAVWKERLREAETKRPHEIPSNGWVVAALQAAWSAIYHTPVPYLDEKRGTYPAQHFAAAVEAAVRAGNDTDTVAAIAGGLLGARWGASAVPLEWQRVLHGWPGYRARDLIRLALLTVQHGKPDSSGWPAVDRFDYTDFPYRHVFSPHPADPHVYLSGVARLQDGIPPEFPPVTAVVSLCRLGYQDAPMPGVEAGNHVEVWLLDTDDPECNPHVEYVLDHAAAMVSKLRLEGHTVLLHCVQAQSRTPTVAALYASRYKGMGTPMEAYRAVHEQMPHSLPNDTFLAFLQHADTP